MTKRPSTRNFNKTSNWEHFAHQFRNRNNTYTVKWRFSLEVSGHVFSTHFETFPAKGTINGQTVCIDILWNLCFNSFQTYSCEIYCKAMEIKEISIKLFLSWILSSNAYHKKVITTIWFDYLKLDSESNFYNICTWISSVFVVPRSGRNVRKASTSARNHFWLVAHFCSYRIYFNRETVFSCEVVEFFQHQIHFMTKFVRVGRSYIV